MDYAMFAMWLSYAVMVAGVIALRRSRPELPRPYRMTGYPVTPVLFLLVAIWFLLNMIVTRPIPSLAALALIATGVPVYLVYKRRQRVVSIAA
jgi:APA family basic amino acid/polyamine antiporter